MSTPYMYNKKCEEVELLERAARVDLETLAQFMILHSFATGHGDSISGLLLEFHPQLHALHTTIASQAKLLEEAQPYLHNLRTTAERHLKKDPTYDAYLIREVLSNTIMIEERLRAAAALHDKLKGA